MEDYIREVRYYETDMMGITHHSNYIRWMEEARIDFMAKLGFPYADMEKRGILSPVRAVRCAYRRPTTFGDEVGIRVEVASFNGVVVTLRYTMTDRRSGEEVCGAESEHCFLDRSGRFVRLKRELPELYERLEEMSRQDNQPE